MKTISKALLKKGVIAISVSAFVGMVYASQMHFTHALLHPLSSKQAKAAYDSPPPNPDTVTDTRTGGVTDTTGDYKKKISATPVDTNKLHYPISKSGEGRKSSFDMKSPIEKSVEVDSSLNTYKITDKIGNTPLGEPKTESFDQYEKDQNKQWIEDYFKRRSESQVAAQKGGLLPKLNISTGNDLIDNLAKQVVISPQGSAELIFSEDFSRVANPTYSLAQQNTNQFKFDQKIQVSVTASIGDKIKMSFKYDTQASFDFENQRKLSYEGKEDEIIKSIQIGDVSMPLSSSLISGSQSLFGVKAKLQFGKLDVTSIFAQEKSDKKEITLQGGAQVTPFNITCDNYDGFRNYFLSQYFRDHFDEFNANWPTLSNIQITRVEVWVTNTGATTINTRSLAAFQDMGENQPFNPTTTATPFLTRNPSAVLPSNNSNSLYNKLITNSQFRNANSISNALNLLPANEHFLPTEDYYVLNNARQLQPSEFTFNTHLGYISLNQQLNPNDVLAVAFQYTVDGKTYQVGEFASDVPPNSNNPNVLFLKMLKSVTVDTRMPDWKLMMKNIYSLGAYQVQPTNFKFQVVYDNAQTGSYLNYLPEPAEPGLNGTPIIRLLGMDRINSEQEPKPDGQFDFIEGVTINSSTGKIIFPVVEPFGSDLNKLFKDPTIASKYVYQLLYDSSHTAAIQDAVHNKFTLVGSYQGSSGSVISLNSINVPQGSVKVYADGVPLVEGTDYTVDYNLGKVTIIKQSILNSGSVIKVTSESNSLFSIQQKTMLGTHLDYHFSKDFTVGGTLLHLGERPLTTIVNVGSEPIDNTIFGFDGHYHTESQFLTDMVNKIPLISTKAKSDVTAEGEYAQIIPGHPATINDPGDPGGVSYIDDFEGSVVPYDLRLGNNWTLASVPQGQPTRFPNAVSLGLDYGFTRAKLSWYMIDNIFYSAVPGSTPTNILGNNTLLSDPFQRSVQEIEVFPNEQIPAGSPGILQTFDMVYRPAARGPYNFDTDRLKPDGRFKDPQNSWAGIQRAIPTTDFEAANIQYVEMWVMDPYTSTNLTGPPVTGEGEMCIDLGTVSEDILHDNRESYENGLACDTTGTDPTVWGRVPRGLHITNAFSTDPTLRPCQDVGYDGLTDADERTHFSSFLSTLQSKVNSNIWNNINNDPSGDNFLWFRDPSYDNGSGANIIQRYMEINGVQNNTPIATSTVVGIGSPNPDDEDINHDFNIETSEAYFEYVIKIDNTGSLNVGKNFVADRQTSTVTLASGKQQSVNWYQFKVPITAYTRVIGPIQDFKSIRFMRIYFTGFSDSINLRFGRLQLVRDDWRKYDYPLTAPGDPLPTDTAQSVLDVSAVSLESDGKRPLPGINYVIPPGIQRQIDYSTPSLIQLNEQSLDLKICNLNPGDARAVFKNTTLDIRQYKTLKMFVHAESQNTAVPLNDGDLHIFIRVGADFTQNYYEYEMPLYVTKPNQTGNVDETWPLSNQMRLAMEEWVNLKLARTKAGLSLTIPYTAGAVSSPGTITVLGNPDIGTVKEIMIGLRRPKGDHGPSPCAEVWVDELRVADFDERGGWAATGRVVAKLADFGRVELTATRQTIGFGGLDQTLLQRNQSDLQSFGLTSSFELGKFFPTTHGAVHIPLYVSYSQQVSTPRYDPLSPDLPLSALTGLYNNNLAKQDSVMQAAQDFTARKNLNFTGVKKDRDPKKKGKPKIYDIENFTATYVYSEIDRHNITSIYDNQKIYSGSLSYAYSLDRPKAFEPFSKLHSKFLKLISDFNLYFLPQSYSFMAKIDRTFSETLYRNTDSYLTINLPLYNKTFFFSRKYDVKYNITKSLRLTYSALGTSRIDEPDGLIDSTYKQQVIWHNILKGGTLTDFTQTAGVAYDVPINKLPYLDFVTLTTGYTGNYEWRAAPPIALNLGNMIQNSQTITVNSNMNFATLYNKVPYLRNILQGTGNTKAEPEKQDSTSKSAKDKLLKNQRNKKQPNFPNQANEGHLTTGETLIGLLMSLRTVSLSYSLNNGTALPGFLPTPQLFGQNFYLNAPGAPFIFGSQADIRDRAAQNGWITKDTGLSQQFLMTRRETITGAIALEPIKSLQIHVDFNRNQSSTFAETYRYLDTAGGVPGFAHLSPTLSGSYSISVLALGTAFVPDGPNNSNATFDKFESFRQGIAFSLASADKRWNGQSKRDSAGTLYPKGYTGTSQDVLIPAFFAAYTGAAPNISTIFPAIPMPNWKISYTGLSSIKAFKSFAKQITITSGYHATYSIDQYATNLNYTGAQTTPDTGNFASKYNISRVTLTERFDPLIGIDVSLVSNWTASFSFTKERQESLSFIDQNVTENNTTKVVFGAGYVTNKFYLPFTRNKKYLKNEVKFRLDCSINDNKQVVRVLDQESGNATGGQTTIAILPNVTYTLSKALTINIFVKRNMTVPYTSNQYPTSLTSIGFSLKYILTP